MNKEKLTGLGGIAAAVIGSVCCVGPIILGGLGFGVGAISFARDFGFLHLPMMVLAFLLLGTAFYLRSRKADPQKENSLACEVVPGKRQRSGIFLWVATGLALILFIYPFLR
jgi:predicted lipid-binding transport protein (Tim44 family)